jgi:amino acid adenylation domain-containing protein
MDCPHPPFEPVGQAIIRRLHATPERCAIRFRDATITNAALLRMILRIAEHLPDAGIGHGTRVGTCFEREPGVVALMLALWLRGAVYVPLDRALPRERLFAMCNTAELDLVVTPSALQATLSNLPCAVVTLDTPPFAMPEHPLPALPAFADAGTRDLAYILFTSGSSGAPKGVKITHGNLVTLFAAMLPLLDLSDTCRILGCANFSFDIAFFELLAPLLCGGVLVLADTQACAAPPRLVQLLDREQVNVVQATPSHWHLLNALAWTSSIDVAIATGEALPRATAAGITQHATRLWNLYGPTECTLWSSAHRVDARDLSDEAPAIISIGSALCGYELHLHPAEDGQTGELVIGGTGVGAGYCGKPDLDAAFRLSPVCPGQRVYYSGDLCRRDAEGLLHYLGRKDNQVKHKGYRIELDEIALVLQQHMSVSQAG